jgi:uncharacterized membrane protein
MILKHSKSARISILFTILSCLGAFGLLSQIGIGHSLEIYSSPTLYPLVTTLYIITAIFCLSGFIVSMLYMAKAVRETELRVFAWFWFCINALLLIISSFFLFFATLFVMSGGA